MAARSTTATTLINSLLLTLAATSLYTPTHLHHHVSAQSTRPPVHPLPVPVGIMGYATSHDQRTFFIQGGVGERLYLNNQFFSLDLTQPSWNTTSPPWKALSVGAGNSSSAPTDYGLAMAVSKDDTQLLDWAKRIGVSTYDIRTGTWNGTGTANGPRTGFFGYTAATDPDTDLVYIPSGTANLTRMLVYDFTTRSTSSAPMPPPAMLKMSVGMYAWAWNSVRRTMMLHGGANYSNFSDPFGNPNLMEFNPSTSTWGLLTTQGQQPPALTGHCMVSALGGSKMVLYGGSLIDSGSTLQGDVYLLDIATLTWTKGPVPNSSQLRRDMACTAAGSNFVVWGGLSLNRQYMSMAVFDLRTNEWTTQFVLDTPPPSSTTKPANPMQESTSDDNTAQHSESTKNKSIIIGISTSVGILIAAGFIWFCIRRRKAQGKSRWSRINNVNVNNKPKRSSKRWSGRGQGPAGNNNSRDPQETNSLQHQIFEQERRSQEKASMSRSNSEKSVSEQLLSPTMTNSDTIVALNSQGSIGGVMLSQEEWLRRQREEVDQERQALAIMQMQQLDYARQMEALKTETFIQR
ncbi:Acyl-CoA-binding domain-containing protein 5 [Linnemannia exigua]|uniref:Acyl-CoA-binding domain-containing protein 5 n=1 Tax=Linnemannia exigua TaxID=604196 RepID=A0AAD4H4D8_9FUNG|nr:Acyl-CoA-binding domain-containing protein 5 [Linnemannia exigua]